MTHHKDICMTDMTLRSANGAPSRQQQLSPPPRGPAVLMQDIWLMEKLAHSDRERIPERVVHAISCPCTFATVTHDISVLYKADLFSQSAADPGSSPPWLARRPMPAMRTSALKFCYTEQATDLVGNTPVLFIRDPPEIPPDFIHSEVILALTCATAAWDFGPGHPESPPGHHPSAIAGIPRSLVEMNGWQPHLQLHQLANERRAVPPKTEQGHRLRVHR